ncbi:MAG: hypothetical protein NUV80_04520 [Candidatus Berkelbacteria bacterium]|nr:hypothetical protein [Candidatus Berkelbacteria bacterium]MCR4307803.1 hypothetical protein [Candidatus Berkelbacteria bacterium]
MKPIYLEPDEEITSIIDRLSKVEGSKIAVVVPKNSTMFQSLVNLKLLARQAQKLGKEVAIISNNKVGSRLAKQVGLETYASLGTLGNAPSATPLASPALPSEPAGADVLPDGTPVHRYSPETGQLATNEETPAEESGSDETKEPEVADKPEPIQEVQAKDEAKQPKVIEEPKVAAPAPVRDMPVSSAPVGLPPIVSRGIQTHHEFIFPWKSAIAAITMVLIAVVITFLFLPKATVTLTFPAKLLSETSTLSAKTDTSSGEGVITGNLITVEKTSTKEITATGKKDVGTKATGTISVKNCEDTNSHVLAAGTKATSGGKAFITASTVTIPAGQFSGGGTVCNSTTVSVSISALDAGETYNLSSATFALAGLASRISGTGSTSGGTTKQITVLSQDDVNKAYTDIKTQLLQDGTSELKGKTGSQTVLDEAIKSTVVEQKVDKEVGAQVDKATASMTLDLYTIAFDQSAVEAASKDKLTAKLEANQELIVPSDKKPTFVFKEITDDKTTLSLDVTSSGFAAPTIDKTVVASQVKNKSVPKAESFLKDKYQTNDVKVEIIPGWWLKRLPILSQAITIEYGFDEATPTP